MKQRTYTAHVKQIGGWWIGRVNEFPDVTCQEATRNDLLESLRNTLFTKLMPPRLVRRPSAKPAKQRPRHLAPEPETLYGDRLPNIRIVEDRG